jgi:hypothetical protein
MLLLFSIFWRNFGGAKHSIALSPVIACGPRIDSGLRGYCCRRGLIRSRGPRNRWFSALPSCPGALGLWTVMQHSTTGMMVAGKAGTRSIRIPSHSAIRSAPHVSLEGMSTESRRFRITAFRRRKSKNLVPKSRSFGARLSLDTSGRWSARPTWSRASTGPRWRTPQGRHRPRRGSRVQSGPAVSPPPHAPGPIRHWPRNFPSPCRPSYWPPIFGRDFCSSSIGT